MRYLVSLAIMLLAPALMLSGCNNSGSMESNEESASTTLKAAVLEPCGLISKSEAETLLGEPVMDAEKSEQEVVGMKLCLYNPVNTDSWGFLQVTLTQQSFMPPGGLAPSELFHSIQEAMSDSRTDIDGIGDEAFIATGGLYILKDEYYITIGAGNIDRQDIQQRLKNAGSIAIKNLEALR